jgi:hypothetical protein
MRFLITEPCSNISERPLHELRSTGRPYRNTTNKARHSLSLFKVNFGTMESETPPSTSNPETLALHDWRFLYSDEGLAMI